MIAYDEAITPVEFLTHNPKPPADTYFPINKRRYPIIGPHTGLLATGLVHNLFEDTFISHVVNTPNNTHDKVSTEEFATLRNGTDSHVGEVPPEHG